MADTVTSEQRSKMMSAVKGKNTNLELLIRKLLYSKGYRYRLHIKNLPGKPDIVISRLKVAIFCNGCFWHKHDCGLFKWPQTKTEFWREKIKGNASRDLNNWKELIQNQWKVIVIWGCAMKGKLKLTPEELSEKLTETINSSDDMVEIMGHHNVTPPRKPPQAP